MHLEKCRPAIELPKLPKRYRMAATLMSVSRSIGVEVVLTNVYDNVVHGIIA